MVKTVLGELVVAQEAIDLAINKPHKAGIPEIPGEI